MLITYGPGQEGSGRKSQDQGKNRLDSRSAKQLCRAV
jgi:hypothetical protein